MEQVFDLKAAARRVRLSKPKARRVPAQSLSIARSHVERRSLVELGCSLLVLEMVAAGTIHRWISWDASSPAVAIARGLRHLRAQAGCSDDPAELVRGADQMLANRFIVMAPDIPPALTQPSEIEGCNWRATYHVRQHEAGAVAGYSCATCGDTVGLFCAGIDQPEEPRDLAVLHRGQLFCPECLSDLIDDEGVELAPTVT